MKTNDQAFLEEAYTQICEGKKKAKPDFLDVDKDGDKKESMKKAIKDKEKSLEEAYQQILENKHINKKFARRYNKVTGAMLKAEPGSDEYKKLKAERDDLVSILKDHGKSPADLEDLLAKKEKENPLPEVECNPNADNQYGDNSYSDTADLESNVIQGDFNNSGTATDTKMPEIPVAVAQ